MFRAGQENIVAVAQTTVDSAGYRSLSPDLISPELPKSAIPTTALAAVRKLFQIWGLDARNQETGHWNPLADLIPEGARVVIKPNWVYHAPRGPASLDSLITHTSVIQAVLEYVALTRPAAVTIGDAPLQSCNFSALRAAAELGSLEDWATTRGVPLNIADFRRTINLGGHSAGKRREDVRPLDRFVQFDLGDDSALSELDADSDRFRVTVYDPDLLAANHRPGVHRYLIAREVVEADVVINMPKLKCHMKAGITGALKNLVGINGNKEYLPHHRKGGSDSGGDCYPGASKLKHLMENSADFSNRERGFRTLRYALGRAVGAGQKLANLIGYENDIEGAWYGNDTVWRMCIDLNGVLMYGSLDGRLHTGRRRTVINITDAIVAGEGEGPLKPTPVSAGFVTGSLNPAAAEYVHARLMGLDPDRIPLIHGAFASGVWPLVDFSPDEIQVHSRAGVTQGTRVAPVRYFVPPPGWRGHCELLSQDAPLEPRLAGV